MVPAGLLSEVSTKKGATVLCIKCGAEIPAGAKFCAQCGNALATGRRTTLHERSREMHHNALQTGYELYHTCIERVSGLDGFDIT